MPYKDPERRRQATLKRAEKWRKAHPEYFREWAKKNRGKLREADKRYRERKRGDPEWKAKRVQWQQEWSQRYPTKAQAGRRDSHLKRSYQLTQYHVELLLEAQGGACALCSKPLEKYDVDHDHATGKARGLLCPSCNRGLGAFRDDIGILRDAIVYLTEKLEL